MTPNPPKSVKIHVDNDHTVSGLWLRPRGARAVLVLAHGAGAGMAHPFMIALADVLAAVGVATLRYQFPFMEAGRRRPDSAALCQTAVRAAVAAGRRLARGLPVFAGGKSFGGRMTSQAQVASPLPGVQGLVLVGFPLHPANRPSEDRGQHLLEVKLPILFLQGTHDALAEMTLMKRVCRRLGPGATLIPMPHADHAFRVPVRSGRTDEEIQQALAAAVKNWLPAGRRG